jgi:hypothetical protein
MKFARVLLKISAKKISKSVWVEAGELKFFLNMLYYFKLKTAYSDLEFLENHLEFSEFFEIFLKKCQKFRCQPG